MRWKIGRRGREGGRGGGGFLHFRFPGYDIAASLPPPPPPPQPLPAPPPKRPYPIPGRLTRNLLSPLSSRRYRVKVVSNVYSSALWLRRRRPSPSLFPTGPEWVFALTCGDGGRTSLLASFDESGYIPTHFSLIVRACGIYCSMCTVFFLSVFSSSLRPSHKKVSMPTFPRLLCSPRRSQGEARKKSGMFPFSAPTSPPSSVWGGRDTMNIEYPFPSPRRPLPFPFCLPLGRGRGRGLFPARLLPIIFFVDQVQSMLSFLMQLANSPPRPFWHIAKGAPSLPPHPPSHSSSSILLLSK